MRKEKALRSVMAIVSIMPVSGCTCRVSKKEEMQDASDKRRRKKRIQNEEYVLIAYRRRCLYGSRAERLTWGRQGEDFHRWATLRMGCGRTGNLIGAVIASKPAGILCNDLTRRSRWLLIPPSGRYSIITFDGELPGAEPLEHIGSDWYEVGVAQARSMAELIGERRSCDDRRSRASESVTRIPRVYRYDGKEYPDIKIVGTFTDNATKGAAEATNNIIGIPGSLALPDLHPYLDLESARRSKRLIR